MQREEAVLHGVVWVGWVLTTCPGCSIGDSQPLGCCFLELRLALSKVHLCPSKPITQGAYRGDSGFLFPTTSTVFLGKFFFSFM